MLSIAANERYKSKWWKDYEYNDLTNNLRTGSPPLLWNFY